MSRHDPGKNTAGTLGGNIPAYQPIPLGGNRLNSKPYECRDSEVSSAFVETYLYDEPKNVSIARIQESPQSGGGSHRVL
jgi:hypothetical protein